MIYIKSVTKLSIVTLHQRFIVNRMTLIVNTKCLLED